MNRLCSKIVSSSKIISSSSILSTKFINSSSSFSKSATNNLIPNPNSNALFYKPYKTYVSDANCFPPRSQFLTRSISNKPYVSDDSCDIVRQFKSAVFYDEFLISPQTEMPSCQQTIHVDGRFYTGEIYQIGMHSRSPEGVVLWARIIRGKVKVLLPPAYSMKGVDVNVAEMAGLGYSRIKIHEMGICDYRIVTDNMLSRDYLSREDNKIDNKSHSFLTLVNKKLWLDFPSKGRVIWVSKYANIPADRLSRAHTLLDSDEKISEYYKAVEDEVVGFKDRIDIEDAKEGREVVKGRRFEEFLKQCMDEIGNSR